MALESGTYINSLVATNPVSSDPKSQGDDHIRLIKSAILATWPNINGAVTASDEELNILDGVTASTAELNILDGATLSVTELNILDGATLTTTELNYIDGVTSAVQTQLDSKAPINSPTLTGTPRAPTASAGASGTQIATLDFVNSTGFSMSLPGQTGNGNKILKTDGTNASWTTLDDPLLLAGATAVVTTTSTQTLTNKTLQTPIFQDSAATTKKANLVLSAITAGQNRNITLVDENMILVTPGLRFISTVTASGAATVDIEGMDATYDKYVIEGDSITFSNNTSFQCLLKLSGAYVTTATYTTARNGTGTTGSSIIALHPTVTNLAAAATALTMWIPNPSSTTHQKGIYFNVLSTDNTGAGAAAQCGGAYNTGTGALTGVRFQANAGTISGNFRLYGVRKS